jgi:hypothetical protein
MSNARQLNALRWRAIAMSRAWCELLRAAGPMRRWGAAIIAGVLRVFGLRARLTAWAYRAVFTADGRVLRRAAEHVLADLREFTFADKSTFDPIALVQARREGRREVFLRICKFLNLDEAEVQKWR